MKDKILIVFLVLAFGFEGFSQTNKFSLLVGGEATKLEELDGVEPNLFTPIFEKKGYYQRSFLLGGKFEQELPYSFSLSFSSSLGLKFINNIYVGGAFPLTSFTYGHFYNSLLLRKNIYKGIALGGGFGYNLFPETNLLGKYESEKAGVFDLSFSLKKYTLNTAYVFGLEEEFVIEATKPSKSFRLTVAYEMGSLRFKKRSSNKKVKCPTM